MNTGSTTTPTSTSSSTSSTTSSTLVGSDGRERRRYAQKDIERLTVFSFKYRGLHLENQQRFSCFHFEVFSECISCFPFPALFLGAEGRHLLWREGGREGGLCIVGLGGPRSVVGLIRMFTTTTNAWRACRPYGGQRMYIVHLHRWAWWAWSVPAGRT